MKILVIGSTGTVGSQVVRELTSRKAQVRVLVRDKSKAPAGVEVVVGDTTDPLTLGPAFEGVDGVFLLTPNSTTETHMGLMSILAAKAAKVKRAVLMTVHFCDRDPLLPHYATKLPLETAVKASGIPHTILRPNNFYQNDGWSKEAILQYGVYPQPIGNVGLSRVDARDIAEAAAVALTTGGHEAQTYNIVGPKVWKATETAAVWSAALGRPIAYGGDDVVAWEKAARQWLPGWMAYDFAIMYSIFQQKGMIATAEDIERQTQMLGHAPRGYEEYVKETVAQWSMATATR